METVDFNIRYYVQGLAAQKAAKMAHVEHQKEQAKASLQREVNHNNINFNHEWPWKKESNLIKIDRSIFKKSKAERELTNYLRSEYKKSQAAFKSA